MRELLLAVTEALAAGRGCALCTLVETRGSTPQKAGAAMLVHADGGQTGTLGGGCVEAEVKRRVLAGLERGRPEVMVFTLDHDYGWDDGLICGGRMSILADPYPPSQAKQKDDAPDYFRRYAEALTAGQGCVEALGVGENHALSLGARVLFGPSRDPLASLRASPSPDLSAVVPDPHARPRPFLKDDIAWLPHWPRIRLVIVGAGHVGQAVADLAAQCDFDVWIVDDRRTYANAERFPRAQRLIVGDPDHTLRMLKQEGAYGRSTFAIIVTRGHQHDEEALHLLADAGCAYLGLIGSQRKIRLIFEDLEGKGVPKEALARVHAPLGIHIGSQTVPEIAVSIVAELIASRNLGHVPAALRLRNRERGEA